MTHAEYPNLIASHRMLGYGKWARQPGGTNLSSFAQLLLSDRIRIFSPARCSSPMFVPDLSLDSTFGVPSALPSVSSSKLVFKPTLRPERQSADFADFLPLPPSGRLALGLAINRPRNGPRQDRKRRSQERRKGQGGRQRDHEAP